MSNNLFSDRLEKHAAQLDLSEESRPNLGLDLNEGSVQNRRRRGTNSKLQAAAGVNPLLAAGTAAARRPERLPAWQAASGAGFGAGLGAGGGGILGALLGSGAAAATGAEPGESLIPAAGAGLGALAGGMYGSQQGYDQAVEDSLETTTEGMVSGAQQGVNRGRQQGAAMLAQKLQQSRQGAAQPGQAQQQAPPKNDSSGNYDEQQEKESMNKQAQLQKEASFVDGFVDSLTENGIQPEQFVKAAAKTDDPSLRKMAAAMVDLSQRRRQQSTKEAGVGSAVKSVDEAIAQGGRRARNTMSDLFGSNPDKTTGGLPAKTYMDEDSALSGRAMDRAVGYGGAATGLGGTGLAGYGGYQAMQPEPEPTTMDQLRNTLGV